MVTYHPDILPFNIAVVRVSEFEKMTDWTDNAGQSLKVYDEPSLMQGAVIKGYRKDKELGSICYSIIAFPSRPNAETIAHEAFHSACDLLEHVGICYSGSDANEVYAYTIGYIVGCINDALNKDKVWE